MLPLRKGSCPKRTRQDAPLTKGELSEGLRGSKLLSPKAKLRYAEGEQIKYEN